MQRNAILDGKDISERIPEIVEDAVNAQVEEDLPGNAASDDWDSRALEIWASNMTGRTTFKVDEIDHDEEPDVVTRKMAFGSPKAV